MRKPITSLRVDLRAEILRIGYFHPENPHEDLYFEIQQGRCDLIILHDFLSACYPKRNFNALSEAKAKRFCRELYQTIVQTWLTNATDFLLVKAARLSPV